MLKIKNMSRVLLVLGAIVALTACHPKVDPVTDMDNQLTCSQLQEQINQVKDVKKKIDRSTGVSVRNVGLGLLFWPGIIINEMSGHNAETDANSRLVALNKIYAKKQCSKQCADVAG